jgi:hypothetical protein
VACASLLLPTAAPGEINALKLPSPPAQAIPATVDVERWGEVSIPLRVAGIAVAPEFRIRDLPRFGKLSEPSRLDDLSGAITYSHTGGETETADSFSYSVRSTKGTSAPAKVTIRIVDPPADFAAPHALDFGEAVAGAESDTVILEIRNRGGGVIEGNIETPDGWRLEGGPDYRLRTKESAVFGLVATPRLPGTPTGRLRYTSNPGVETELKVRALPPLAVSPDSLELSAPAPGLAREARLTVANRGPEPLSVHLSGDPRLALPKPFSVASSAETTVTVSLPASDLAPIDAPLRLESEGFDATIPVRAGGAGALLRIEPAQVDFGEVAVGETGSAEVALRNLGPDPVEASLSLPPPLSLEGPIRVIVEPSAAMPVAIRWQPERPGTLRAKLSARSPAGDAEAVAVGRAFSRTEAPATGTAPAATPAPAPPVYRIERSRIRMSPEGKAVLEWFPFQDVEIWRDGQEMLAHAKGFSPGEACTMRILTIPRPGESIPSAPFQIQLNPLPARGLPAWTWLLSLPAATGILLWIRKRKKPVTGPER